MVITRKRKIEVDNIEAKEICQLTSSTLPINEDKNISTVSTVSKGSRRSSRKNDSSVAVKVIENIKPNNAVSNCTLNEQTANSVSKSSNYSKAGKGKTFNSESEENTTFQENNIHQTYKRTNTNLSKSNLRRKSDGKQNRKSNATAYECEDSVEISPASRITSGKKTMSDSETKLQRPKRLCRQVVQNSVTKISQNFGTKREKTLKRNERSLDATENGLEPCNSDQNKLLLNRSSDSSLFTKDLDNKTSVSLAKSGQSEEKVMNDSDCDSLPGGNENSKTGSAKKVSRTSESESVSESESEWTAAENSNSESDWAEEGNLLKIPKRQKKQNRKSYASSTDSDSSCNNTRKRNVGKKINEPLKIKKQCIQFKGKIRKLSESDSDEEVPNIQLSHHILEKVKMEGTRKKVFSYSDRVKSNRDIAEARLAADFDVVSSESDAKLALKTRLPDIKPILKYFGPYFPLGEASTSSTTGWHQKNLTVAEQGKKLERISDQITNCTLKTSKRNSQSSACNEENSLSSESCKKSSIRSEISVCGQNESANDKSGEDSSSAESDWEEVSDVEQQAMTLEEYNPEFPKDGIEITVDVPDPRKRRRKKRQEEFATYARRHINRYKKDTQIAMHKVHLLGFLAHSLIVNDILNDSFLKGIMLSILPNDFIGITTKKSTSTLLTKMVMWFRNMFVLEKKDVQSDLLTSLLACVESKTVYSSKCYCYLFIVMGRVMQLDVRLCKSVYPISFKPADLLKTKKQRIKCVDLTDDASRSQSPNIEVKPEKEQNKTGSKKCKTPARQKDAKASTSSEVPKKTERKKIPEKKITTNKSESTKKSSRVSRRKVSYSENRGEESGSESDQDFEPVAKHEKKLSASSKKNRKILSSDSEEDDGLKRPNSIDDWAEVFLNAEGKWVSVDIVQNIVSRPYEIEENTSSPVSYVLAVDNDSKIKDVTQRYASSWLTQVRKERVDPDWWEESLESFMPPQDKKDKDEQRQLESMLSEKPLPAKIGDFKNHPLYVLKRHLLKFEGLFPPEPPPLGFIRSEPVYARECVRMLHSRETWLKQGRAVKVGQQPYKVVKARPKWDKVNQKIITDLPLDVFGEWQTEVYVPPPCKDGKVPRNEYGNIEIFQPSMLPKGAVHLQLPGLSRVARKLGIDCAPALVGFEGNGWAGSMPVFDGFVACEEFKEVLIAAWDEEQVNIARREKEKRDKRVYGNWRKLIRGLLIREKIKSKYFGEKFEAKDKDKEGN